MDSAFFSYTPRFGDSSDWGVIAIALTMPDHVLSWMVGNAEVMLPLTRFDRRYRCSIVRIGGSDGTRTRDLLRDRQLNYAPQGCLYPYYCASDTLQFPLVSSASLLCHLVVP